MGLKSVPRKTKKSTPIVQTPPPPPPPPTKSSSSASTTASSSDDENNTAVSASASASASSSSTSTSNTTVPTTSTPPTTKPPSTTTPTIPTPTVNHPTPSSSASSDDDSSPPPMPTPVSSKRPAEPDTKLPEKRPKKDDSTGPSVTAATPQKLFQRLWSNDDEIVILKGMIDYMAKKGSDPVGNIEDFLSFVKKSLFVVDVNKRQLKDKIQRLQKRFFNAKKKKLSDPHEIKAFEFSQKIWGTGVHVVDNVENRVVGDGDDDNNKVNVVEKVKKKGNNVVEEVMEEEVKEKGDLRDLEFGFSGEDGVVLKEVMKSLGEGERREVKKMVGKANEAYLEAYLLRLKVLEVAAKKMLDGLRKD